MIKRKLFDELKAHLQRKEISLIIGPRQSGKTTLMLLLKDYLIRNEEKNVFFNLDVETDRSYFSSQSRLLGKIQLEIGKSKGVVFIDEIQRKENAGLFLKGLYDLNLQYKFIVSGSGSLELKEKIHESLIGRKRIFELSTVTFEEFVNYRTEYKYENTLSDFFEIEKDRLGEFFKEYLQFGGYPRVILADTLIEKQIEINEIYQSYLEKDISFLLNIQKTEKLSDLVRVLASQVGKLVNFSELSNTLRLSSETIKKYIWFLEKTFIINKITPFYKNIKKEITKSPVYYFCDLGLRNYSLGLFNTALEIDETGFILQNFVFNILKNIMEINPATLHFWRTQDKAEVDFVILSGKEILPIEVKYKFLNKPVLSRSFRSFLSKYKPLRAFIVNLNYDTMIKIDNTEVYFIPYYKLRNIFYDVR